SVAAPHPPVGVQSVGSGRAHGCAPDAAGGRRPGLVELARSALNLESWHRGIGLGIEGGIELKWNAARVLEVAVLARAREQGQRRAAGLGRVGGEDLA